MKRHEALAPLSREHHSTLMLAQLLKKNAPVYKGLPTNAKDKAEYAFQQFETIIKNHFKQEEIILRKAKDLEEKKIIVRANIAIGLFWVSFLIIMVLVLLE